MPMAMVRTSVNCHSCVVDSVHGSRCEILFAAPITPSQHHQCIITQKGIVLEYDDSHIDYRPSSVSSEPLKSMYSTRVLEYRKNLIRGPKCAP